MAQGFKTGDLVKLKSGGPVMTVKFAEDQKVWCVWFQGEKYSGEEFRPDMLVTTALPSGSVHTGEPSPF